MLLRFWRLIVAVAYDVGEKNVALIAAGVAFFGIFALFPGIAAIIAIFGLLADPGVVGDQLELMKDVIPADAYDLFETQITGLLTARTDALGWAGIVSIALAIWSSRAGVSALMGGLNAIEARPARGGVRQILVALLLTASLVSLAIVALFSVVITPIFLALMPLELSTSLIFEAFRWGVALFVLLAGLSVLYRYGPNMRRARRPWITWGAAVVVVLWVAASISLSYYLTNFASYNEVYGSLGAVIGLMLWLYISAYLILLGAALNMQLYGAPPPDPTDG